MKLLVVSHACITPLNQSFYADVAEASGWDVTLVVPASWKNEYRSTTQIERWPELRGEIVSIPVWKAGNIPLHVYRQLFVGLLRRINPDAIYVHHEPYGLATAQVYLANRLTGNRTIGFYTAQNIFKQYPAPIRLLESYVLRQSSFCFPVTNGALEVVRGKGYTGLAEVLPLPVDPDLYARNGALAADWRNRLGLRAQVPVIGYIGRLVEEKGLETLLYSLKRVEDADWCCVLAGSGPHEKALRELSSALGLQDRIVFAGFIPHGEAPGLLSMFDLLVLASQTKPNWKEQFGRVIIEANACGTPVIGTDSGEIPHVLQSTGGGLIVREDAVDELSGALLHLIQDPEERARLGRAGAEAVRAKYSQRTIASRFIATIEQVPRRAAGRSPAA